MCGVARAWCENLLLVLSYLFDLHIQKRPLRGQTLTATIQTDTIPFSPMTDVSNGTKPYDSVDFCEKKMSNPIISSFESQNANSVRLDVFFFIKECITAITFGHRSDEHQLPSKLPVL